MEKNAWWGSSGEALGAACLAGCWALLCVCQQLGLNLGACFWGGSLGNRLPWSVRLLGAVGISGVRRLRCRGGCAAAVSSSLARFSKLKGGR